MSEIFLVVHARHTLADDLSDSDWNRLNEIVCRLEQADYAAGRVDVGSLVPPPDNPLRRVVLVELLKVDQDRRFVRGQPKRVEQYLQEWPELANDELALLELIAFECGTSALGGAVTSQDELARRFPALASQLDLAAIQESARQEVELVRLRRAEAETRSLSDDPSSPTWIADVSFAPGDRFGHYEIRGHLGKGGMGTVYRAYDTVLQREVALKIPRVAGSAASGGSDRFLEEARAAARIRHPHVCPIYHAGQVDGTYYIAMALIEGRTLAEWLRGRVLTCREAADIVRKLAEALAAVHQQSILHRDIKPHNVMMDARGEPLLMDFGLARRKGDAAGPPLASFLGTIPYMPPELVSGNDIGATADIYGLGVLLYELLTGRPPYEADAADLLLRIVRGCPTPIRTHRPDVDPELERICAKAMSKTPDDRHPSASELAAVLSAYLRRKERAVAWRNRILVLLGLVAILTALAVALFRQNYRGDDSRPEVTNDARLVPNGWQREETPRSELDDVPVLPWRLWGDLERCVLLRFSPDGGRFFALIDPLNVRADEVPLPSRIVSGDAPAGAAELQVLLDRDWQSVNRFAVSRRGVVFVQDYYHNRIACIPNMSEQKIEYLTVTKVPDKTPAWVTDLGISPDDQKLVVLLGGDGREVDSRNNAVSVVRRADKTFTEIPLADEPERGKLVFSADSRFAYVGTYQRDTNAPVLYVLQLEPTPAIVHRLRLPDGRMRGLAACPERRCLFVSDELNRGIWTVSLDTLQVKRWRSLERYAPGDLAVNAQQDTLAVLCPKSRATLLMDLGDGAVRSRVEKIGAQYVEFAPDGHRLFLTSTDKNWAATVDTRATAQPSPRQGYRADPHEPWHNRAERRGSIVFASNRSGEYYQLYWTNADGTRDATRWTFSQGDDLAPVWSPTEDRIAFISNRSGQPRIHLLDPTLGVSKCLEETRAAWMTSSSSHLSWSPDGQRIAYVRSGACCVDVVDVETGQVSTLCDNPPSPELPACRGVLWSHADDQLWLVWGAPGDASTLDLFRFHPRDKSVSRLPERKAQESYYGSAAPSPDGGTIAVTRGVKDGDRDRIEICLMTPAGKITKTLASHDEPNTSSPQLVSAPSWSPDGKYLVYAVNQGTSCHLCRLHVETCQAEPLPGGDWNDIMPDVCWR